jgi:hypothetical protein
LLHISCRKWAKSCWLSDIPAKSQSLENMRQQDGNSHHLGDKHGQFLVEHSGSEAGRLGHPKQLKLMDFKK